MANIMTYYPQKDYYVGKQSRLPEVVVTGKKKKPYWISPKGAGNMSLTTGEAMKGVDAATGPLLHWIQPSQYVGAFRDAVKGKNPLTSILRGNSGVVSEEYAQEHPVVSTLLNLGTDAAAYRTGAGIFNTFSKINKYRRLERNYTGVPHNQTNGTPVYMDETFPTVHNKHTVWATDDVDYARMYTISRDANGNILRDTDGKVIYGKLFDVYTDPNELSILETPTVPEGQMVYWQGLPYKLNKGKVTYADNIEVRKNAIPKTKEIAINNRDKYSRYDFNDTGSYIWKDGEGNGMIQDWRQVPGAVSTDKVVKYSKNVGLDGTRFNKVYDGGVTFNKGVFDYSLGDYYDYPVNELVLNPGASKYVLPHGTPKYKVLNQLPNSYSSNLLYNLLPLTIPTKLDHE